jgi:hypothetical protein
MEKFYADFLDKLGAIHSEIADLMLPLSLEALDWQPLPDIPSICVLVVHVAGAEKYWVGDVIAGENTSRIREQEFKSKGKSVEELIAGLGESRSFIQAIFSDMGIGDLSRSCISPRDGSEITVAWALNHAIHHSALHLGHIQIIRQLWASGNH